MSSNYEYSIPSYSPHDHNLNASQSPWSASSQTGGAFESLAPLNLDPDFDPFDFNDNDQYFDSLPRLPSPVPYLPEPSTSRHQEQQPPPSNQQARQQQQPQAYSRYRVSASPDPFDDFIDQDFDWPDSPRPQRNAASQNTTRASSLVDLTESSPPPESMAPILRKRKATPTAAGTSKRARPSATPAKSSRSTPARRQQVEKADVVDLVGIENEDEYNAFKAKQQAETIKQQQQEEADKPVKLSQVECIICMDRPTDLTVTHCGHLFCSECLHEALHAGPGKKTCPVCRAGISTAGMGKDQKKQGKTGYFALEMKFVTANKKGKQPVRG